MNIRMLNIWHNCCIYVIISNIGSFLYHQSSTIETRFLQLPTYYRLCYISMAITLNMTSLRVFAQSSQDFYFFTTTLDQPLLPWSLINISLPSSYTTSLSATFRSFRLWFIGVVADDFSTAGEGTMEKRTLYNNSILIV